jgi:transcriptional regulator with XRE-family HTH domain
MSGDLGKIMQAAREKAGWTQDELGKSVGVSQQTIAKWEAGKSYPRPKALQKLIEVLGVTGEMLGQSREFTKESRFDDAPSVVVRKLLDDTTLYPFEKKLEENGAQAALPASFPSHGQLAQVANSKGIKRLLAPIVNAIEPSSQWDAVVHAQGGNIRVDYVNDELYAQFLHAPNTMLLTSHLKTTIYRILWKFITLSELANMEGKYQVVIVTLPQDQPVDIVPNETGRYVPPVTNTRMLGRLTSEALSKGIYLVLARTPADVVSKLTEPSSIFDPGWPWPGNEWYENPDM